VSYARGTVVVENLKVKMSYWEDECIKERKRGGFVGRLTIMKGQYNDRPEGGGSF
jgi:hypothetical protein